MLLALETATDVCSVALLDGGRVIVELSLRRPRQHATHLAPLVQDALRYAGLVPADLDAVAVSMGPGSYTGLRIGTSTAKGLCAATDAALVGVPTLEALAATATPQAATGDLIVAALDARRDDVYAAAFRMGEAGVLESVADTAALATSELAVWLDEEEARRCWLVGDGAEKAAPAVREHTGLTLRVLPPAVRPPSAAWVGRRAWRRFENGTTEDVAAFEPFYLKAFVAEHPQRSAFERLP